jgi:nicotinamide-nucleotide amidase
MIAQGVVDHLIESGETIALAESITGGAISVALTEIPGSSKAFLGGVVAYSVSAKVSLLGVPEDRIERFGVVSAEVAMAMADGVREKFHATWGLATTGVAGPGAHDGVAAGEIWIAIAGPVRETKLLTLGELGRSEVRSGAVTGAIALLSRILSSR